MAQCSVTEARRTSHLKNAEMIQEFEESIRRTRSLRKELGDDKVEENTLKWLELAQQRFDIEFQIDPMTNRLPPAERERLISLIMSRLLGCIR